MDSFFLSQGRGGSGWLVVIRYIRIIDKGDASVLMVDTNAELSSAGAAHNIGFNLFFIKGALQSGFLKWCNEGKEVANFDGRVNLGELGEQTGE